MEKRFFKPAFTPLFAYWLMLTFLISIVILYFRFYIFFFNLPTIIIVTTIFEVFLVLCLWLYRSMTYVSISKEELILKRPIGKTKRYAVKNIRGVSRYWMPGLFGWPWENYFMAELDIQQKNGEREHLSALFSPAQIKDMIAMTNNFI